MTFLVGYANIYSSRDSSTRSLAKLIIDAIYIIFSENPGARLRMYQNVNPNSLGQTYYIVGFTDPSYPILAQNKKIISRRFYFKKSITL